MEELKYSIVRTGKDLDALIRNLNTQERFVFDFECSSLDTHSTDIKLVSVGFCHEKGWATTVPFNGDLPQDLILERLKPIFEDDTKGKIGHNLKFDCRLADRFGIKVRNLFFDTMIASYALYGDRTTHNLDDVTLHHFGHTKIRTKTLIPKKSKTNPNPSMLDSPIEDVAVYNCEDVDWTWRLYQLFQVLLKQPGNEHAYSNFYEIDMPLVTVLLKMECDGLKLDESKFESLREEFSKDLAVLKADIDRLAGKDVSLTKTAELSTLLYDELKINAAGKKVKRTKTGYSTNAASLQQFKGVEIVDKIAEYKQLSKLINTYVTKMPEYISGFDGLVHPSFNQIATATARLAVTDPPCQQIPTRTKQGKRIRETFVSRFPGGKILAVDFSQAELRILAHLSKEPVFLEAYRNDIDIHTKVACEVVYKKPQVTVEERYVVKTMNFALLYGARAKKLAETLKIPVQEAEDIITRYMEGMGSLKRFLDASREELRAQGYTENYRGRRRYIPKAFSSDKLEQWSAEREGANHKIQSANADIVRVAMVRIHDMLEAGNYRSIMILQVHDELVFDLHPAEVDILPKKIQAIMETVVNFDVIMKTEAKVGDNWSEAH